jgi:hypothetical protein
MHSMADKLASFYRSIKPPTALPKGFNVLYPQKDPEVTRIVEQFFQKYFNDEQPRGLMLGINPGRHGAGMTGVNFTAPRQLKEHCGIDHHFRNSSELSAEFIYEMIASYGGAEQFYRDWFIGSVCPLGFTTTPKRFAAAAYGKNVNYYDDKKLQKAVTPFIIDCIEKQVAMGFAVEKCLCVGGEKNFKFLSALNDEYKWFKEIIPLPHPRFILQYRRKQKEKYISYYLSALGHGG